MGGARGVAGGWTSLPERPLGGPTKPAGPGKGWNTGKRPVAILEALEAVHKGGKAQQAKQTPPGIGQALPARIGQAFDSGHLEGLQGPSAPAGVSV